MTFKISVLDQSPVMSDATPAQAVNETVALAKLAEDWGYHRYWLAEHHNIRALGDPCPEILLARIGAATERIRIGTGGILLPYYAPLKVAEQFRMLEALYPGRIDLGIGRAPGGDGRTARALSRGTYSAAEDFPQQVQELAAHLDNILPVNHPAYSVRAQPVVEQSPPIWLLGSSDYSGLLAAALGLRFAFAHFISAHGGDTVTRAYKERFEMGRETAPHAIVCAFVICAPTDAEAERLATAIDLRRLHMARGVDAPIPSLAEADAYPYNAADRAHIERERARLIHGDPARVKDQLLALGERFAADELMVLSITPDYATRQRSYQLIAKEFH